MGSALLRSLGGLALVVCIALLATPARAAPPKTIQVGRLTLTLCRTAYTGYCGSIQRAIDPSGVVPGQITVGFEYYPRSDTAHPSLGTILPQEGGPGYSSTGTRDFYLSLFAAMRDRREVVIVDKRGTGLSDPVRCKDLQTGAVDLDADAACAKTLGDTAWFYGTDFAAADIMAVLDALDIDEVDFYGDSYGTFVGQILAGLFPHRLRSIILDSAYPVRAPDPWFGTDWAAAWSGIDLSCGRSPSCSSLGGSATARMEKVVRDVRHAPLTGNAPDGNGDLQPTTLDTGQLIYLIDSTGYGPPIYRDLDAAARAWLDSADPLPLLRLVAEINTASVDHPAGFSYGLYEAVTCTDYPLLYNLNDPRAARDREYASALQDAREHRPGLFAPFTVQEGIDSQVYITPLDSCLPWPAPPADLAPGSPGKPLPKTVHFPPVPTLVLSGDLDSVTSIIDANEATEQLPNAVHVIVPNLGHVVSESDEIGCTLGIVQRFVSNLSPGNTACVQRVRPVRTVPLFAQQATQLAPLEPRAGNHGSPAQLRLAASALEAVGDVIARYWVTYNYVGSGLRGGKFTYAATNAGYDFKLNKVQFTNDVAVSGTVAWNQVTNIITAHVTLQNQGAAAGSIDIRWNDADINAVASVSGTVGGAAVVAQRIAP